MDVAGRRHAEPALERGSQVGDDVAEQVVGDDHLKLPGVQHQVHRQRVDVVVRRVDAGIARRRLSKYPLPQGVAVRHRVALVRHANLRQPARSGELERVADDSAHTFIGVDLLLDRYLIVRAGLEASADAHIDPFRVLAEHDEADVPRPPSLQRTEALVQQLHRPVVDIEVQLEARAQQDIARVPVVRNARVAEGADEDRVERPERVVAVRGNRDAGLQVVIRTPRQMLELERPPEPLADGLDDLHSFGSHFPADAVAGNDGDLQGFYGVLQGSTGFYGVLQGSTRFYEVLQGSARFCKVLQGSTGFYRVL